MVVGQEILNGNLKSLKVQQGIQAKLVLVLVKQIYLQILKQKVNFLVLLTYKLIFFSSYLDMWGNTSLVPYKDLYNEQYTESRILLSPLPEK